MQVFSTSTATTCPALLTATTSSTAGLNRTCAPHPSCMAEYQRLQRVVTETGQLIYDCDLLARQIHWQGAVQELSGYTAEELQGVDLDAWKTNIHPDDRQHAMQQFQQAIRAAKPFHLQYRFRRKDGSYIAIENHGVCTTDSSGKTIEILGILSNITERKRLESRLQQAQRLESIGVLAGGIAHDLNNVLSPILMACQLLELEAVTAEHKRFLSIIRGSAQRGADLVKQVLSFSRGISGRRISLQPRNLIKELEQILTETFPKSIQMETRLAEDLWLVTGDPTQLHQVLLNLCLNARDAMPSGGQLTIAAENLIPDEDYASLNHSQLSGPHVVISVTDTGVGISHENLEKIFDPFFTTKEIGKGTGLGLSTSLAIAKSHGGTISVYSDPGHGTVFKVYLPALRGSSGEQLQNREPLLPRGHGELVLIIDDEAAVRTMTAQALQDFGYRAIAAANGADALALYSASGSEVALVLTDLMMPVMDGPATLHALKRINPKLQAIVFSGFAPDQPPANLADVIKSFLPKPFTAEMLLCSLDRVLHAEQRK